MERLRGHRPKRKVRQIKMGNISELRRVEEKGATSAAFIVGAVEYSIPLEGSVDVEAEMKKLEAELKRYEGFLAGVEKKLANEKFVSSAPEKVVALERKKKADATEKIAAIKASMAAFSK